MCGLVGVAGKIGIKEERAFHTLLQLDTLRGPHSTGILFVNADGETQVHKRTGTPWDLYDSKKVDDAFRQDLNVLIGHNRWATKGKITNANAHPFECGNIIGAHNGTLTSTWQLDDHLKFDVDSENIFHHMDGNDVENTINKLNGAFALTWYNKEDKTVNFIRNSERTLHYVYTKDRKSLFWASEEWMLKIALAKAEVEHHNIVLVPELFHHCVGINFGKPFDVKPFDMQSVRKMEAFSYVKRETVHNKGNVVDLQKKQKVKGFKEHSDYLRESLEFFVSEECISTSNQPYFQCYKKDDDGISIRVYAMKESPLWKLMKDSPNFFTGVAKSYSSVEGGYLTLDLRSVEEVIEADADMPPQTYVVFNNKVVSEAEYKMLVSCTGCAWCGEIPNTEDSEELQWVDANTFVCAGCQEDGSVKEYLALAN